MIAQLLDPDNTGGRAEDNVAALVAAVTNATQSDRVLAVVAYAHKLEIAGMVGSGTSARVISDAITRARRLEMFLSAGARGMLRMRLIGYKLERIAVSNDCAEAAAAKAIRNACAV
ncbi:MAG: hypothetical protein VW491_07310 [Gammaproteobacteria bacterium]